MPSSRSSHSSQSSPSPSPPETRERLLLAAVDVFGRNGFAETSTRMLAAAAGVNLQAIPYHFGSKEQLYLAVASHIADRMLERVAPSRDRARALIAKAPLSKDDAQALLNELLEALASLLLEDASEPIARFIVREQMEPTAAFDHLYEHVMAPQLEIARKLVATLLGADPRSHRVRLRTVGLLGSVVFLRTGHTLVKRQLGWSEVGAREMSAVRAQIQECVRELRSES
jgi:AcrR family transcriptional regulator